MAFPVGWIFRYLWWGRWDLNPGSPTPQAGILNHSSPSTPSIPYSGQNGKLYDDPTPAKYEAMIINTLLKAKAE
jgi:hypothetical protein